MEMSLDHPGGLFERPHFRKVCRNRRRWPAASDPARVSKRPNGIAGNGRLFDGLATPSLALRRRMERVDFANEGSTARKGRAILLTI